MLGAHLCRVHHDACLSLDHQDPHQSFLRRSLLSELADLSRWHFVMAQHRKHQMVSSAIFMARNHKTLHPRKYGTHSLCARITCTLGSKRQKTRIRRSQSCRNMHVEIRTKPRPDLTGAPPGRQIYIP